MAMLKVEPTSLSRQFNRATRLKSVPHVKIELRNKLVPLKKSSFLCVNIELS